MGNTTSTITSKWQVTIPEDVRKDWPLKVGQRIVWEVQGDKLVGQRLRSMSELSGCLKSPPGKKAAFPRALTEAALARHERISRQKP